MRTISAVLVRYDVNERQVHLSIYRDISPISALRHLPVNTLKQPQENEYTSDAKNQRCTVTVWRQRTADLQVNAQGYHILLYINENKTNEKNAFLEV